MPVRLMLFCSTSDDPEVLRLISEIENTPGIDEEVIRDFKETLNQAEKIRLATQLNEPQMLIICGNETEFATEMKKRNSCLRVIRFYGFVMEGPVRQPFSTYVTVARPGHFIREKGEYREFISDVVDSFLGKIRPSSTQIAEVLQFATSV